MRTIAIIPARAGSKRCLQKNIRPFADRSLTILACEQAMRLQNLFEDIVLTTNSDEAIKQGMECGIKLIRRRPDELCTDLALSEDAIDDVIKWMNKDYDYIILLEPTSPLRSDTDIIESLKLAEAYGCGVKSVTEIKNCLSGEIVEPKQQLNGAIHIWKAGNIRDIPYTRFVFHHMPPERSIHIDYPWEFDVAEMLYKGQKHGY